MSLTLGSNVASLSTLLAPAPASEAGSRLTTRTEANPPGPSPTASIASIQSVRPTPADVAAKALDHAASISDAATGAGATISNLLVRIRQTVVAATDPGVTPSQRRSLETTYPSLVTGVASAVKTGGFHGVNLLDGSTEPAGVNLQTGTDGAGSLTLHGADLTPHGSTVDLPSSIDLSTPVSAKSALDRIDTSIVAAQSALSRIDTQSKSISAHADALSTLSSAGAGASDTTDADAAGLIALQVRQQLTSQSTPLVNRSPQSILSLFKS